MFLRRRLAALAQRHVAAGDGCLAELHVALRYDNHFPFCLAMAKLSPGDAAGPRGRADSGARRCCWHAAWARRPLQTPQPRWRRSAALEEKPWLLVWEVCFLVLLATWLFGRMALHARGELHGSCLDPCLDNRRNDPRPARENALILLTSFLNARGLAQATAAPGSPLHTALLAAAGAGDAVHTATAAAGGTQGQQQYGESCAARAMQAVLGAAKAVIWRLVKPAVHPLFVEGVCRRIGRVPSAKT